MYAMGPVEIFDTPGSAHAAAWLRAPRSALPSSRRTEQFGGVARLRGRCRPRNQTAPAMYRELQIAPVLHVRTRRATPRFIVVIENEALRKLRLHFAARSHLAGLRRLLTIVKQTDTQTKK
jgi:hypothetical protein